MVQPVLGDAFAALVLDAKKSPAHFCSSDSMCTVVFKHVLSGSLIVRRKNGVRIHCRNKGINLYA